MELKLNEERFWHALRQTLKRAEAEEAAELAAAERMLAETTPDAGAQLSEDRIAEVVRLVTSSSSALALAEPEEPDVHAALDGSAPVRIDANVEVEEETKAAPVVPIAAARSRWQQKLMKLPRPLAAAAMILLTPQFLLPMTAVTVVVVASALVRYTSSTLNYQDAISIMLSTEHGENTRRSAQQVVWSHLSESIRILQEARAASPAVASRATQALSEVGSALAYGGAFSPRHFADAHLHLGDQIADAANPDDLRVDAISRLADQMVHGATALRAIEQTSPALSRDAGLLVQKLTEDLSR